MRYMLDTNACILLLAGDTVMVRRAGECDEGDLVMSAIAYAELALGSWGGKQPPLRVVTGLPEIIPIVAFDEGAARQYATLPFRRRSYDRLIAAHALSSGLTLVTANERDFADVPGLAIENWSVPGDAA